MAKRIDNDIVILMEHIESIDVTISSLLMGHLMKIDSRLREKEKETINIPTPEALKNVPNSVLNKNTRGDLCCEFCKHPLSVINPFFPWGKIEYKCRYKNCVKFEGFA